MKFIIFTIASIVLIASCTNQLFEVIEKDIDNLENKRNLFDAINFNQIKETSTSEISNSLFDRFAEEDNQEGIKSPNASDNKNNAGGIIILCS
jgi:hypothetical protein